MINGLKFVLFHPNNKGRVLKTLLKLSWWKINQLFFKISGLVNLNNKVICICPPESSFGSLVVYTTLPEYKEMLWIQEWLKKGESFIDVGANIGVFTLLGASKVGKTGKVVAFEPDDRPRETLLKNLNLNRFNFVKIENKIVSDKNKKINFYKARESELSRIVEKTNNKYKKNQIVLTSVSLDVYAEKIKMEKIDLLKIDVEGAELKVIKGARKLLEKKAIKAILFEHNPYNFDKETTTTEYLKIMGYEVYSFIESNKLKKINILPLKITNLVALPK